LGDDQALLLAKGLIEKYGAMARGFAEDCASVYFKYGDPVGMKIWQKIAGIVEQLLAAPPPGLMH
jgi:hypothetical protein